MRELVFQALAHPRSPGGRISRSLALPRSPEGWVFPLPRPPSPEGVDFFAPSLLPSRGSPSLGRGLVSDPKVVLGYLIAIDI